MVCKDVVEKMFTYLLMCVLYVAFYATNIFRKYWINSGLPFGIVDFFQWWNNCELVGKCENYQILVYIDGSMAKRIRNLGSMNLTCWGNKLNLWAGWFEKQKVSCGSLEFYGHRWPVQKALTTYWTCQLLRVSWSAKRSWGWLLCPVGICN